MVLATGASWNRDGTGRSLEEPIEGWEHPPSVGDYFCGPPETLEASHDPKETPCPGDLEETEVIDPSRPAYAEIVVRSQKAGIARQRLELAGR